jgi:hypothetical protein
MKTILTIVLSVVCVALIVVLFFTKKNDSAQFESDASAFNECSNSLDAAQSRIVIGNGTIITLSNNLNDCQSALLTSSNNLVAAQATIDADSGQITNLTQQVARLNADSQALGQQVMDMTNRLNSQMAALSQQLAVTQTNMAAVQHDQVLLEERLRQDVGERLVIQRKFYNFDALQAQMDKLKGYPGLDITADQIYKGLDIEVRSNGTFHVLAPE